MHDLGNFRCVFPGPEVDWVEFLVADGLFNDEISLFVRATFSFIPTDSFVGFELGFFRKCGKMYKRVFVLWYFVFLGVCAGAKLWGQFAVGCFRSSEKSKKVDDLILSKRCLFEALAVVQFEVAVV